MLGIYSAGSVVALVRYVLITYKLLFTLIFYIYNIIFLWISILKIYSTFSSKLIPVFLVIMINNNLVTLHKVHIVWTVDKGKFRNVAL